jgi:hypothetical protein
MKGEAREALIKALDIMLADTAVPEQPESEGEKIGINLSAGMYYTMEELCTHIGWCKSTMYNCMKKGLAYSEVGGRRLVHGPDLQRYLENRKGRKRVDRRKA